MPKRMLPTTNSTQLRPSFKTGVMDAAAGLRQFRLASGSLFLGRLGHLRLTSSLPPPHRNRRCLLCCGARKRRKRRGCRLRGLRSYHGAVLERWLADLTDTAASSMFPYMLAWLRFQLATPPPPDHALAASVPPQPNMGPDEFGVSSAVGR
jgi:hypothetical protein